MWVALEHVLGIEKGRGLAPFQRQTVPFARPVMRREGGLGSARSKVSEARQSQRLCYQNQAGLLPRGGRPVMFTFHRSQHLEDMTFIYGHGNS